MERTVMASALASPPPPLPFGASDLKRNARTFLERALLISAMVHLAAVGAFRAAYERLIPTEEETTLVPTWHDPSIITRIHVVRGWQPPAMNPSRGVFDPVEEKITIPTLHPGEIHPEGVPFTTDTDRSDPNVSTRRGPPPPRSEPMHAFNGAEIPPVPISAPLPAYPDFAREARIEGKVMVEVLVGTDGLPKKVVAVSGPKPLFAAAVEGVRRWKFRPGMTSGYPVECKVVVPVVFILQ